MVVYIKDKKLVIITSQKTIRFRLVIQSQQKSKT